MAQTIEKDSIPIFLEEKLSLIDSLIVIGNYETAERGADQAWNISISNGYEYARAWILQQRAKISQHRQAYDQAVRHFLESNTLLESSEKIDKEKIAQNLLGIGEVYEAQKAHQTASEYYTQAAKVFEDKSDWQMQVTALQKAGGIFKELEAYENAAENFSTILRLYKIRENILGQIKTLGELIDIQNLKENYEESLSLNKELLEIFIDIGDSTGMTSTYNNMGFNYSRLGQHEEALEAFKKSYELDKQLYGSDLENLNTLLNIGIAYQNLGNTTQSIEYLLLALEIKEGQNDWVGAASIHDLISKVYLQNEDYHNANLHVESAIQIAEDNSEVTLLSEAYNIKSDILQKFGDYEEALHYYRMHLSMQDSLMNVKELESERLRKLNEELDRKDQELREKIAEEQRQDIINQQLRQRLKLVEAESEIADFARKEELFERKRLMDEIEAENQRLKIAQLEAEKQKKESEIREREALRIKEQNEFENQRKLQQAELQKKEDEIKLQQKELQLKEQTSRIGKIIFAFVFVSLIMSILWLLTARKQNKRLAKQKDEIKLTNAELEQKTEEVLTQAESLRKANEEISKSHEELETQRDAIRESYKKLEETYQRLQTAQTKLIESEKMASLGQLTAGIAHEINNPINFISGNINPLKRDISDIKELLEKIKHFQNGYDKDVLIADINHLSKEIELDVLIKEVDDLLLGIEEGAKRTKEIVLGLRNFSRLDENDYKLVDINQGIESTITLLKNKMRDRITLHTDLGNLPKVDCLPGQLNQVFMNIINNAIQAIKGKGNIYINTFLDNDEQVKVAIRDDGDGIDEHIKNKIFDPFFTTKDVGEGTGLGLSISYGIVKEQHNGNIEVDSKKGEGTTFVITLPLKQNLAK